VQCRVAVQYSTVQYSAGLPLWCALLPCSVGPVGAVSYETISGWSLKRDVLFCYDLPTARLLFSQKHWYAWRFMLFFNTMPCSMICLALLICTASLTLCPVIEMYH